MKRLYPSEREYSFSPKENSHTDETTDSRRTIPRPPPLPEDVQPPAPSAATPRTTAARARGRELGQLLRRNAELVLAILGAAGISAAQALTSAAALWQWAKDQGLWPALAIIALGVAAAGIRQLLTVVRQLLTVVRGLSVRLDGLAQQWQAQHTELREQHDELRDEVHELRSELRGRTGPTPLVSEQDDG